MQFRILPIIIILSLLTVGILGFFGLGSIDHSGQHYCPVSLISGGDCPFLDGSAAFVFHHILGLQNFIQSIINFDAYLLMIFILLIATSLAVARFLQGTSVLFFPYQTRHRNTESNFKSKKRFLRWLAIHYKRDLIALQWVHDVT